MTHVMRMSSHLFKKVSYVDVIDGAYYVIQFEDKRLKLLIKLLFLLIN